VFGNRFVISSLLNEGQGVEDGISYLVLFWRLIKRTNPSSTNWANWQAAGFLRFDDPGVILHNKLMGHCTAFK